MKNGPFGFSCRDWRDSDKKSENPKKVGKDCRSLFLVPGYSENNTDCTAIAPIFDMGMAWPIFWAPFFLDFHCKKLCVPKKVNHGGKARNCYWKSAPIVSIVSDRFIKKDEELLIDYGHDSYVTLLSLYGFTTPGRNYKNARFFKKFTI